MSSALGMPEIFALVCRRLNINKLFPQEAGVLDIHSLVEDRDINSEIIF